MFLITEAPLMSYFELSSSCFSGHFWTTLYCFPWLKHALAVYELKQTTPQMSNGLCEISDSGVSPWIWYYWLRTRISGLLCVHRSEAFTVGGCTDITVITNALVIALILHAHNRPCSYIWNHEAFLILLTPWRLYIPLSGSFHDKYMDPEGCIFHYHGNFHDKYVDTEGWVFCYRVAFTTSVYTMKAAYSTIMQLWR